MKNTDYLLPITEQELIWLLAELKKKHKKNKEKSYKVEFLVLGKNKHDKTNKLLCGKSSLFHKCIRGYSI